MVYADLHVHTTRSDGTLEPEMVEGAAREAGLGAVAVTDHERVPPFGTERRGDLSLVGGTELRVEADFGRVDLLGYGVSADDALESEFERLQTDRVERGREMVCLLENRLGVTLDVAIEEGVGRPDIARAVANHPELDYTVQGVFDELIGDDGPCYVARDVPSFERGATLLSACSALVALAHPLRYPDPEAALSLLETLDAVEYRYPYEGDATLESVERAIEEYRVLATGGSDAHGETVGEAGLSAAEFGPLASRLDLPVP